MGSAQALFAVSGGGGGRGFNQIQTVGQTQPLGDYSPETQAKLAQAERRRQITNLLVQKGLQGGPPATSTGRFIVPRGAMQNVGDLATLIAGLYGNYKADESAQAAIAQENAAYEQAIAGYKSRLAGMTDQEGRAARPAIPAQPATTMTGQSEDENVYTPPTAAQPAIEAVPASTAQKQQAILDALLQSRIPAVQRYGFQQQVALDADVAREEAREEQRARETFQAKEHQLTRDLQREAGAEQRAFMVSEHEKDRARDAAREAERITAKHEENELARTAKEAELQAKLSAEKLAREEKGKLEKELQGMRDASKKESDEVRVAIAKLGVEKPTSIPGTVMKTLKDDVGLIGGLKGTNADLLAVRKQIESGTLDLGALKNVLAGVQNWSGLSTESSRNLQTFNATLERLRNQTLLLNKGVQTEGDAIRAWNELLSNINDPEVVKQRLDDIINTNDRKAHLVFDEMNFIRDEYKRPRLDYDTITSVQPAAIGKREADPKTQSSKTPPVVGTIQGGYKFMGGDPSQQKNWNRLP